jgi:hypothetical protein
MEETLKRLQKKLLNIFKGGSTLDTKNIWDYKNTSNLSQLEHNLNLKNKIKDLMESESLDIIITSPEICVILENFEDFFLIGKDDVYNYKRYKSDIPNDFQPFFLINDGDKNIGLVIKNDFKFNENDIILTNTQCTKYKLIRVDNIPFVKLLDFYRNN